jgi:drug/metabolite transporter (DMT)-like permease
VLAWLCFVVVVVGWGSSFFGIRLALPAFTPLGLVAARNLLAALVMAAVARGRGERPPERREALRLALIGRVLVGASNYFTTLGQRTLSSGVGGLLNATISLWIVLLSARREPPPRRVWAGIALGLAGVALLLLPGKAQRISWAGVACMGASTFSFAWAALRMRQAPSRTGLAWTLALQMGATGLVTLLLALSSEGVLHARPTGTVLLAVLYLTAVPSLLAYGAFAVLARLWPPSRFGIYAVLTPVVAVLLGTLFLREPFTARMGAAMAVILGGVALVQRR